MDELCEIDTNLDVEQLFPEMGGTSGHEEAGGQVVKAKRLRHLLHSDNSKHGARWSEIR